MATTKKLTSEFFAANRQRLMEELPSSIFVLAGNFEMQAKGDMAYPFKQESNFWWLSGLSLPDWRLLIDGKRKKSFLIAPKVDEVRAVFDGDMDKDDIMQLTGVNEVLSFESGEQMLREVARTHSMAYGLGADPHESYYHFVKNPAQKELWHTLERTFATVQDCRKSLARLRAIKSSEEIAMIEKAIQISANAFSHIHDNLTDFSHEHSIEAEFTYRFRKAGSLGHAYDPIVAASKNACTLHYTANSAKLSKKQLLLLDIGAEYEGYAADITRTYAYGTPTKRQAQVHAAVQEAHNTCIGLLGPGVAVAEYLRAVDITMKRALQSIGLLESLDDETTYRKYFPHAISHGLGVDVHDSLGGFAEFQPGMVLTVEPGIYIPDEDIGVRIEDDILITATDTRNLSASLSTAL